MPDGIVLTTGSDPTSSWITTHGGVKVLDFDLAKKRGATGGDAAAADLTTGMHTEAGVAMGTRPYMSAGQVR